MLKFFRNNLQLQQEVIRLTIPVIAEQLFITLMGAINTVMAGHINKEAAAAIGMVDAFNNIFIFAFSSLAVGGTVVVAHYIGQGNLKCANEASKQAIYSGAILSGSIALIIGIFRHPVLTLLYGAAEPVVLRYALTYLEITLPTYPLVALTFVIAGVIRGSGDTRTPAKVVIFMNVINVIFSYLLIFGISVKNQPLAFTFPSLGVRGAALGIGIARLIGALILIFVLARGTSYLKLRKPHLYHPDFEMLKSILKIGIPAGIESLSFTFGKLITQTFVVAIGTVDIVANYVGMSIHTLSIIPGSAFSVAATTLVGQYMGRGEADRARKSLFYMANLATVSLLIINISSIPFFNTFASWYTPNSEINNLAAYLLKITSFFMLFWGLSFVLPSGLRGAGDVKYTLTTCLISMWLFRITLGYILCVSFKMGVLGIWVSMYLDWIIRGTAFFFRLRGESWKKHVVVKQATEPA